jgi:uncharacterized protein (DUF362 family)
MAKNTRRTFLKNAAAATTLAAASANLLSGCSDKESSAHKKDDLTRELPAKVSDAQRQKRVDGRSSVAIIAVDSYEEDIFELVKMQLNIYKSGPNGFAAPDLKNKTVVLKPNMVEFREGKPVTTNPAMLKAAILLAYDWGAKKVIVAEGPGHMRDTEFLLAATGLGPMCKAMDVPFVDLNLDDIEEVENKDGFNGISPFFLPKTIVRADAVISLPKLKTHHWVGVTCTMKNLFGVVPGRKYGWPKNLLHIAGIPHSIIDLQHMVKPCFGIVDAIVTMEGDGPINGTAKHLGYVVMGAHLPAVDATCVRMMKLSPQELPYIRLAGEVVSTIDENEIDLHGPATNQIACAYEMPRSFTDKSLLKQAAQQGS